MNTEEKKNAILKYLYDKGGRELVKVNDIVRSYPQIGDVSQIAQSLKNQGYIEGIATKDRFLARITTEGRELVENLSLEKSQNYQYQPGNKISAEEQEILRAKVDELFEHLKKVEIGQQVIYDDLFDELQQLKKLVGILGKKDWKQLLQGKLIDAGLGSLTNEVLKAITDTFSKQNLLN